MKLRELFKAFVRNRQGYIAVVFGLLALPLVGIAGAAIDYRNIGREYGNLQKAAEAAALAVARSKFKPARTTFSDPTEDPTTLMNTVFNANFPYDASKFTYVTPTLTSVDETDKTVTVTVTAGARTSLLQVIGFSVFDISVVARAAAVFSSENVQIHFVIDLSPSMGAPADGTAPPLTVGPNGSDGCFFMCHDDGSTIRNAGKTPKLDVVYDRFGATNGMAYLIQNAAAANPIPITAKFWGHYFDHHLHAGTLFANAAAAVVNTKFVNTTPRYILGNDGINGGTDLKTSFEELHTYLSTTSPAPANTRRIIIIVSDGMHSRAVYPFDPSVCTTLKNDGDIFTLYVKNPESVYRNPNLSYVIPGGSQGGMQAVDTWDWTVLLNGGSSPYGYYTGLNNAEDLMKNCASRPELAYQGETSAQITDAIDQMTENIIAPTIRVLN